MALTPHWGRYSNTVAILAMLATIAAILAYIATQRLEKSATVALAEQTARTLIKTVNNARILYSKNAVDRVNDLDQISVGPDYLDVIHRIPNPATMAIELGESVSDKDNNLLLHMYSQYPFPGREETGGPRDEFESAALSVLETKPDRPYLRVEKIGGVEVFRYAEAIVMEESCIRCHNSDPNSPKKDWNVGDVRGAVALSYPLFSGQSNIGAMMRVAYVGFSLLAVIGLISLLVTVVRLAGVSSDLEQAVKHRTQVFRKLAETDALTGIANRRAFEQSLSRAWKSHSQSGEELSLVIFDLDRFKEINDRFGHDMGDHCLQLMVHAVNEVLRTPQDIFARCGGEEFAVILPQTGSHDAEQVAARIRAVVEQIDVDREDIALSCSLGVSTMTPADDGDLQTLVHQADQAMYQAKDLGRNRLVVWGAA